MASLRLTCRGKQSAPCMNGTKQSSQCNSPGVRLWCVERLGPKELQCGAGSSPNQDGTSFCRTTFKAGEGGLRHVTANASHCHSEARGCRRWCTKSSVSDGYSTTGVSPFARLDNDRHLLTKASHHDRKGTTSCKLEVARHLACRSKVDLDEATKSECVCSFIDPDQ